MVMEYGMSESLGPIAYETRARTMLGLREVGDTEAAQHSQETLQEIDREVRRIVDEVQDRVRVILRRDREPLDSVAERLLDKEVMDGDELNSILEVGTHEPVEEKAV